MAEIESRIVKMREAAGINEFHWSDYRGGARQAAYEALINYGFDLVEAKHAAFHVIIAKFAGYDHKAKPGENRETSVNRMYYQLLLHCIARFYGKLCAIHVRLDAGNDSKDICGMRNELCAASYKKYSTRPNCVRSLQGACSKTSPIIQMSDVIVGGISAKQNDVVHTSAKGPLADFIERRAGVRSWKLDTPAHARFLTVWHHASR